MANESGFAIGVDFGGTNIVAGLVSSKGKVTNRVKIPSLVHLGRKKTLKRIAEAISLVLEKVPPKERKKILGIGIGSPGLVDHNKGIIRTPPNLPGWKEVHLKDYIEKKLKIPTYVVNDANAYAVGEHTFGAGRNISDMICITLGTGLGGGIILNNVLFVGYYQSAGELGHIVIIKDGKKCNCGNIGCVERYVGAEFIAERVREYIKAGRKTMIKKMVNNDLKKITPKVITDAAKNKDRLAIQIWNEVGEDIGVALTSIINIFSPQMIIIGGGVSLAGKFVFDPIRKTVKKRVYKYLGERVKIVPGKLFDDAPVLGAASFVWHHF